MARHSRKSRKSAVRSNAGRRRSRKSTSVRRHSRKPRNPAMIGRPKDWVMGGAGALAGFVGSAALPQMFLGAASNTGMAGYAASAAAAIGLGFLAHFLFPREQAITVGVVSGGFANLIRRIITDQTPFGSYLNAPASAGGMGMGDYMVANWGPPRMQNGLQSAMAEAPGTAWGGGGSGYIASSSGVSMQDMSDIRASRPC